MVVLALALLPAACIYGWYVHKGGLSFLFGDNISILPSSYFMKSMGPRWAYVNGSAAAPGKILLWAASGLIGPPLLAAGIRFASISRLTCAFSASAALVLSGFHAVLGFGWLLRGVPEWLSRVAPFLYFNRGMLLASALLLGWTLFETRRTHSFHKAPLILLLTAGIVLGWRTVFKTEPTGYSIFYDELVFAGYLIAVWKTAAALRVPDSPRLWVGVSAVLCLGIVALATASYYDVRTRSFAVSSQRGTVYQDRWTGEAFTQAAAFLSEATERSQGFVVWPEEAALYYFTGATAPSRWYSLTPGILAPGEASSHFLDELDRQDVRYVALSDRETAEYGVPTFGIDYNQQVYRWLEKHFHVIRTFGDFQRIHPRHWAVQIWERNGS